MDGWGCRSRCRRRTCPHFPCIPPTPPPFPPCYTHTQLWDINVPSGGVPQQQDAEFPADSSCSAQRSQAKKEECCQYKVAKAVYDEFCDTVGRCAMMPWSCMTSCATHSGLLCHHDALILHVLLCPLLCCTS